MTATHTCEFMLRYNKLPAQALLADLIGDPGVTAIMFSGGVGSGKSFAQCMTQLTLSVLNYGCAGGLVSPTFELADHSVIETLHMIMGEQDIPYKFKKQRHTFELPWHRSAYRPERVSRIQICSGDKPESIIARNWGWFGIDEPGQIQRGGEVWQYCTMRLRDKRARARQGILTGTPEDIYRIPWLMEKFVDPATRDPRHRVVFASLRDAVAAGTVAPEFLENLVRSLPKKAAQAYIDGQFVAFGGTVYFCFDPEAHTTTGTKYDPALPLYIGMDFNVSPMCGVIAQPQKDRGITVIDEIRLTDSHTREWCEHFRRAYPGGPNGHRAGVRVFADATGRARKTSATETDLQIIRDELADYRDMTRCIPDANPPEWDRVLAVNNAFEKGWITIDKDNAPWLVRDLVQTPKKDGENAIDKTKNKDLSHSSDALGYMIHQLISGWGSSTARQIRLGSRRLMTAGRQFEMGRRT
uniref:Putative terminase n=1 Tax=viral metagenome TaxID=1070528 RepID=A0A6M3IPB1_9ZZZZ